MNHNLTLSLIVAAGALTTGCASVMNDTSQPIRVETKTQSGELVTGADCKLTNDRSEVSAKSGSTAMVRRSDKDLDITCTQPQNPQATARAVSRANAGLAGNILIGGGIGAIIDHTKGTAYTYPTWVQLVFGQSLVFDRRSENEGQPVPGVTQSPAPAPAVAAK